MTEHKIIVEESDGGSFGPKDGAGAWRAECECGWKGKWARFDSFTDTIDPADSAHDAAAWVGQQHMQVFVGEEDEPSSVDHLVSVEHLYDASGSATSGDWRGTCTCGWVGPWSNVTDDAAKLDADKHAADVQSGNWFAKPARTSAATAGQRRAIALERIAAELRIANQLAYIRQFQSTGRGKTIRAIEAALFGEF